MAIAIRRTPRAGRSAHRFTQYGDDLPFAHAPTLWQTRAARAMAIGSVDDVVGVLAAVASRATTTAGQTIIGPEDDVAAAAAQHAAAAHGHHDTPELREQLRRLLEPESACVPGEPFPA